MNKDYTHNTIFDCVHFKISVLILGLSSFVRKFFPGMSEDYFFFFILCIRQGIEYVSSMCVDSYVARLDETLK